MANQFNNQKCSKCYSKNLGLEKRFENYYSSCQESHSHFFKKNGRLFCIDCLMTEGHVKCQKCHKLISHWDEMGKFIKYVITSSGDHTCDVDGGMFGCNCRGCSKEFKAENNPNQSSYSGWGPGNPEWEKQKWCRIAGCPYKVSSYFEAHGVCGQHVKQCQGIISSRYSGEIQCNQKVPIDGGDFCEGCKNQTETYQQRKSRLDAEGKQLGEKYKQAIKEAQSWWDSLSSEERQKEIRSLEVRLPARIKNFWNKRGYENVDNQTEGNAEYTHWDTFENGKLYQSDPTRVPWAIVDEFYEKFGGSKLEGKTNGDNNNSPSVNTENNQGQPIKEGNASENDGKITESGDKYGPKKVEIVNSEVDNKPDKNDNEALVINLKEVKKITLRSDGKLEIEFNGVQTGDSWYSISQVIIDEQISSNQELQKIKNYCQQNGKESLSQEELNSVLNSSNSTNSGTVKPTNNNHALAIGLSIIVALIVGLAIGRLLLKRKKDVKRS